MTSPKSYKKYNESERPRMLTPAELEALAQEMKKSSEWMQQYLAKQKRLNQQKK